jgi:hypothetical protein
MRIENPRSGNTGAINTSTRNIPAKSPTVTNKLSILPTLNIQSNAMLPHIKILSLWEIAHYWHDCDPRVSQTHHLPLKVRDTLLVFATEFGSSLNIRVEQSKAYLLEAINHAPRLTARHYRHSFKKSIESKVFGKRFFSKMYLTRSQLARWCLNNNEELPKFWFPDNDKFPYIAEGDLSNEITAGGRYKVQLLYDDRPKPSSSAAPQEQPIAATVNENAVKAAQASHAATNAIKDRFIHFFNEEGQNCPSKKAAAEYFFDTLHETQEKLLFSNREAAVRTLLDALRAHKKKTK